MIQRNLAGTKSAHGGAVFASPLALALLRAPAGWLPHGRRAPADDEAGALSETASLLGPETGEEVAEIDADAETAIYAETEASVDADPETLDSAIVEASDDAVAETEAALSLACLDGVRDPVGEECDLAGHSARSLCSSTCASRDVLALPATSIDAGVPLGKRSLGLGRHTVAADPSGLAVVFGEDKPARFAIARFDSKGIASDVAVPITTGGAAPAGNPVVAPLGSGEFVGAWTTAIDGDGPGIAVRVIGAGSLGPLVKVNVSTGFTQRDPDVLRVGSQLVFAWTDSSSAARGPDVKYRLFSTSLAPLGGELELAGTLDNETDVALAPFGSSWMAAWRAGAASGATETIVAKVDGKLFFAGPGLRSGRGEAGGGGARWHARGDGVPGGHGDLKASLAAWARGLVSVWEDFGSGLAATAMHPDVVVEFVGVPVLRLGGGDGGI
ncbi:MAG: hypothetical protein IPJ34_19310 [Myxococcales bacterium]|nr:hypothetical protein [Myxococcales bacterium]